MNTFGFDVPNLDDIECDITEYYRAEQVLLTLANYMNKRGKAKHYRLIGEITIAKAYEQDCENLYESLPHWARW